MKLNTAPQNEAIVSNVGEIGEFRIRNSAKAFNILSSGLYANKVRAIIRELSCNAVDSHVAAGRKDTPFDVHLPNQMEPWFSIRDYGTGLDHDQVTNIYTTYFESTKTESNDFIGALGLGSKSPFSYTDNFTVTAIKDGRKGIYTAFINDHGVPSIALMMQEDTDEPSGVEVKFAVDEYYDFSKFEQEAKDVYKFFSLKPVISGKPNFTFNIISYEKKDVIPGVHIYQHRTNSVAIMGNIAYPIDVPQADTALGDLRNLLSCGIEMHFDIGELDFQASREGLSYIPQTVESIKRKLAALNDSLTVVLAKEANEIANLWDRAMFLEDRHQHQIWRAAVRKYVQDYKLPTYSFNNYGRRKSWDIAEGELAKLNIQLKAVHKYSHKNTCSSLQPSGGSSTQPDKTWNIEVDKTSHFVVSDVKTGIAERVKYHYRQNQERHSRTIYILEPIDRTLEMDTKAFFDMICNPPEARIFKASTLNQAPRKNSRLGENVTLMKLQKRDERGWNYRDSELVWRNAGKLEDFDSSITYYYIPLVGYAIQSTKGYTSVKELYEDVTSFAALFKGTLYGVRKADIESIRTQKNWVNIEEHVEAKINEIGMDVFLRSLVKSSVDSYDILKHNNGMIMSSINPASPYTKTVTALMNLPEMTGSKYSAEKLFIKFGLAKSFSASALEAKWQTEINDMISRYPLLKNASSYRVNASDIAEYINLIDEKKGI